MIEGWSRFYRRANADKLHVVLPWNDPDVPWLAVFIGGLWIPNIFYWGLNQFITQRTLGARSLAEGQKGILFAALMKLAIPFVIVMPGIMALQLYGAEIEALGGKAGEKAYPYMIAHLLPPELRGIMFAALFGAVMSTFNSGVNSASTIFTIDVYRRYVNKDSSPSNDVRIGRWATAVLVVVACLWAPMIHGFKGVFAYIQEVWGFITPGIVAVFLVGIVVKRAPARAARTALLLGVPLYAICRFGHHIVRTDWMRGFTEVAFLHHMAIVFLVLVAVMLVMTRLAPLEHEREMPTSDLDLRPFRESASTAPSSVS